LISTILGYGTAAAASTSYGYDLVGNRISVTDADRNVTQFTYNAADQVLTSSTTLGTTTNTCAAFRKSASKEGFILRNSAVRALDLRGPSAA
jgi:YD repeat-containing protein